MKTKNLDHLPVQNGERNKPGGTRWGSGATRNLIALAALVAFLAVPAPATAQGTASDNFDSGTLDTSEGGWQVRNICQLVGGFVADSFVPNGAGKALRLQRGSFDTSPLGVPQAYGTGRAWLFRTNDYTDFYASMDLVNWNDQTNQAMVLLARGSGFNDSPNGIPGLGAVNGYVMNYDNVQDGSGPGDRYGGQVQINRVVSESPGTIAAADATLTPGHSYRMILKGEGSRLTAKVYDLEDLTAPIVTVVADDNTYPSGKSGIVTFHRDDTVHPNRTDLTVDNYYSSVTDPNADIAPAIRHPVPGTPQLVTRIPASRFTNFHSASAGISFTARTFTSTEINASATKLFLNEVDFSSALAPLPANGSTVSFTTAPGALVSNKVYSARIELEDVAGTVRTTNTFWFDTYSDAALAAAAVQTIECEDYNYSNGLYKVGPIPVTGYDTNGYLITGDGAGYWDDFYAPAVAGTPEVDYHRNRTSVENGWAEYRGADHVDTLQGIRQDIEDMDHPDAVPPWAANYVRPNDNMRQQYAAVSIPEFEVFRTEANEWLNYTRPFTDTNYYVFLRCSSLYTQDIYLDQVTSDPTVPAQTTTRLGTFQVKNHIRRAHFGYEQLTVNGAPAVVHIAGTNTLRLTMGGVPTKHNRVVALNYLLFVPTTGAEPVLSIKALQAGGVKVSWPLIPHTLLTSPSLSSPKWTPVLSGIAKVGDKYEYTPGSSTGPQFFKLVYP